MSIALFAIIGATIKAGVAYWICFSLYCMVWATRFVSNLGDLLKDEEEAEVMKELLKELEEATNNENQT